jgi:hypothetical protein
MVGERLLLPVFQPDFPKKMIIAIPVENPIRINQTLMLFFSSDFDFLFSTEP